MKKFLTITLFLTFLAGCAAQEPLVKQTASGYPEGIFRNSTLEDVQSKIVGKCAQAGLMVFDSSSTQVVCGKTMDGMQGVFTQALMGNRYSTTPERKARFILYKQDSDVVATARSWVETQMAFGQMQKQEIKNNDSINEIQNMFFSLGAE